MTDGNPFSPPRPVSFSAVPFSLADAFLAGAMALVLHRLLSHLLPALFPQIPLSVNIALSAWILPACLALPVWLVVRRKGLSLVTAFRLQRSAWPRSLLIAFAVTLVLQPICRLLFQLNLALSSLAPLPRPPLPSFEILALRASPTALALALLSAVLFAPFCEELFFRGILFSSFRSFLSAPCALVVTSAFFAWIHGQPMDSISLTVSSIGFTLAALWARSLAAAILVHVFSNLLATATLLFFQIPSS